MKHPQTPADQRRTHDLGFSDEGPHDVATLIRILGEREAEIVRLRAALAEIDAICVLHSRSGAVRMLQIAAIITATAAPKEEGS